jgi:hypothetical protein
VLTHLNISNSSISINTVVTKEKTYYEDSDGDEVTDSDEETEEVPDISGVAMLANAVKDMGTLTSLDVSNNYLGQLVPPEGWTKGGFIRYPGIRHWAHTDGRKEEAVAPSGSKPAGIIALANGIPDMRALTCLNLALNSLGVEGAKIIAACLPKCTYVSDIAIALILSD